MDDLDRRVLRTLPAVTRPSVLDLARRLGVARGTAQARLDRLRERGVVAGWQPTLDRRALGFPVLAFVSMQVAQGHERPVLDALGTLPEVLEAHQTTGEADLLQRVVARSNEHLHAVLQSLLHVSGVVRTHTALALTTPVERTMGDAVEQGLLDRDGR